MLSSETSSKLRPTCGFGFCRSVAPSQIFSGTDSSIWKSENEKPLRQRCARTFSSETDTLALLEEGTRCLPEEGDAEALRCLWPRGSVAKRRIQ